MTSYDGVVYFGLNADADSMPDLAAVAQAIEASVPELLAVTTADAPAASLTADRRNA